MESIINDNLKCPICLGICDDPVESSCCNHLYCKNCVDSLTNKCPLCKSTCNFKASLLARRMVNMLPVSCDYCKYQCTKGDLNEHHKKCDEIPWQCPIENCNQLHKRQTAINHLVTVHHNDFIKNLDDIADVLNSKKKNTEAANINANQNSISIDITKNSKGFKARLGASGKYYCGQRLDIQNCLCCNGFCGPTNGCNCSSCMKLDIDSRALPKGWLVNTDGFSASIRNGRFYCGRKVMVKNLFCDGYCGPTNGPNCASCQKLDAMTTRGGRYAHLL